MTTFRWSSRPRAPRRATAGAGAAARRASRALSRVARLIRAASAASRCCCRASKNSSRCFLRRVELLFPLRLRGLQRCVQILLQLLDSFLRRRPLLGRHRLPAIPSFEPSVEISLICARCSGDIVNFGSFGGGGMPMTTGSGASGRFGVARHRVGFVIRVRRFGGLRRRRAAAAARSTPGGAFGFARGVWLTPRCTIVLRRRHGDAHRLNLERVDERRGVAHRQQDVADVRRAIRRSGRHRQRRHLGQTLLQIAADRGQPPIHLPRPRIRLPPVRRLQRAPRRLIRIDDDHTQRQNREEKTGEHKLGTDLHQAIGMVRRKLAEKVWGVSRAKARSTILPRARRGVGARYHCGREGGRYK